MNSQLPEHRTPMLNPQCYDDSKLQRRTKFLVSGLLLCFVIGVASLGISIMILMKNQDLPDLVDYVKKKAPQNQKMKGDLDTANSVIADLQREIETLKTVMEGHTLQLQSLSKPEETKPPNGVEQMPPKQPNVNFLDINHDYDSKDSIDAELLDRNLDLFFIHEGSGDQDDDEEYDPDYYDENGSGDSIKCVVFPEPYCPDGHQICWTDDSCPVPFCCERAR